jgi:phenylacetate-CoA ligase
VVITNLIGDTQPLLRFRSRDISKLATTETCACGFTGARLEGSILGRVDDMIWLRGANVFPSAIETAVRRFPELSTEYQIEITGQAALAAMTVRVEALRSMPDSTSAALRNKVVAAIRESIRVTADVEIVPAGSLPRPEGARKMRRVIDKRAR